MLVVEVFLGCMHVTIGAFTSSFHILSVVQKSVEQSVTLWLHQHADLSS